MFGSDNYRLWHGASPMARFFRDSDPGMFLVSGSDSTVRDRAGRDYLDARSSMWNVTLGYSCEPVKAAIHAQLELLPSGTVMRYEHPTQVAADYAARLADTLPDPLNYVRFGNTGSQMTEAAAMLSRYYRRMTGQAGRDHVITVQGGYHGTGPLATALTADPVFQEFSAPLDRFVRHVGTPDFDETPGTDPVRPVLDLIDQLGAHRVTAIMLEPVLGNFMRPVPLRYLNRLLAECRARDIHVIADEVTTGAGRAGSMTVSERLAGVPDMVVLGKGLSAGYFPLAALVVSAPLYDRLAGAEHPVGFPNGSTTDGHPLGMAAGAAVLDVITAPGFFASVRATAAYLTGLLRDALAGHPAVRTVGGEGMMIGVELAHPDRTPWSVADVNRLRLACRDHGLLTSYAHGVLPLLPPLTISRADCEELARRLAKALHERGPA
ncbi:MAG TPA: aminotransferase class III-fold pyridoxal phosphate-dependent enzyme [Actinophytocola sp.]|uniref:aminotransferase class III-fold pyridoxal phosphate-dependent enzyme n=1 Tax=Actinophytocola sp. TaxID=1872138 RepID=UPI002DB90208|nr:aminotransferase class III-fold pyridoxal phosphate-dependent enzyme [Actinophytocola sp.]HEU5471031.1 aminotransferase class III-fold pyridoxal phosphate-dependent enzyme [Actinophytocola sp.]